MASNPVTTSYRTRDRSKTRTSHNITTRDGSRNRAPQKITTTSTNSLEGVLSSLECPVCLETFCAPIYICKLGHNICGSCRDRLRNLRCPLCNSDITGQRNFTLEEIAEKCSSKCPNAEHGCTFVGSKEKISYHTPKCSFQRYLCPMGATLKQCNWKGLYTELIQHFTNIHPRNMIIKPGLDIKFANFDVYKEDRDLQLVTLGKNMCFLYHVLIDPKNKVANWAIQKIGSEKTANKFDYEFIFQNHKKGIKTMEECRSSVFPVKQLYESGNCVSIPLNVLKNFINPHKELTFKMFIRSKEESYNISRNFRLLNTQ